MVEVDILMRRRKTTNGSVATFLNVTRGTLPEIICKSVILMEKIYTEANDSCVCHPSLSSKIRKNRVIIKKASMGRNSKTISVMKANRSNSFQK